MKYDEDEEVKEFEKLNKIIENNLQLEIAINENSNDISHLLKKYDWKILDDKTFLFKQNIQRVWEVIKSLDFLFSIINSEHYTCIFKKGSNIYNLGNIFEGKFLNTYDFNAKVIKEKIYSDIKKIEWLFFLGNGEDFRFKIILYKVTEDNSTVLHVKIKYIPTIGENIIHKIKEKFNENTFFKNIEKMLEKKSISLYQYESGIIPGSMEEIWDILTDSTKLTSIAPNNSCFVPIDINKVKVGDISKISMTIKSIEGYLEIKLDLKEKKSTWNVWAFGYSILGGGPFKIIKQTVTVQLTKINKYETQLSVFTKIHESIAMRMLKNLSEKKKYVISSLKDYFENFSTPQDYADKENYIDN